MGLGTDSALDSIVHPGLHAALPQFYPTSVVIQAATLTQRPNGEPVETWGPFLMGLTGNLARSTRTNLEQRGTTQTTVPAEWVLNLAGWYPLITVAHRAVVTVNGQAEIFNIAAVVHDSVGESTRLELERTEH